MIGGIDKLAKQLAVRAEMRTKMAFDNWRNAVESPIECLLLIGFFSLLDNEEFDYLPLQKCEIINGDTFHGLSEQRVKVQGTLLVQLQYKLLDWRADFVLSCPSIADKKIIVECDGHDFHERTKDQAARDRSRDRAAQEAGHMMLRYTGSEIYRDPLGCAESAIKALQNLIEDRWLNDVLGADRK